MTESSKYSVEVSFAADRGLQHALCRPGEADSIVCHCPRRPAALHGHERRFPVINLSWPGNCL